MLHKKIMPAILITSVLAGSGTLLASADNPINFVNADWSSLTDPLTTSQLWYNLGSSNSAGVPDSYTLTGLAASTLVPTSPGYRTGSGNFYSFMGNYSATATVYNYGGADGSAVTGGTYVTLQTAASINPDFEYNVGLLALGSTETPTITFTTTGGTVLTAQLLDFEVSFSGTDVPSLVGEVDWQELTWTFYLPDWTGDFKATFDIPVHVMFSAVQIDTAIVTAAVPEPASLAILAGSLGAMLLRRRKH